MAKPGEAPAVSAADQPPLYYVEPQAQPRATDGVVFEPPAPFFIEPPPPPPLPRRAPPRTAFWVGVRASFFVPFGSLWLDGYPNQYVYRRRSFANYASPGAAGEVDVGVRLSRHYNVFALYEHATLGTGSLDNHRLGGQQLGASNLYGVGLRFSTDPTGVGFLMEVALGYRDFRAYWRDGTELTAKDGWLDARIGIGADVRLSRSFSLSPMLVLGGGSFGTIRWSGPGGEQNALTAFDQGGQYGNLELSLGAHADVF